MILYPFQPERSACYVVTGFDETRQVPAGELLVLQRGDAPDSYGSRIFCPQPPEDSRFLQPVSAAPPQAPAVFVSTQISGGSLPQYLRACLDAWGSRLWVFLDPICMLFPVPCPTGLGRAVGAEESARLQAAHPSHFSPELLCRYSFFLDSSGRACVFLFDTHETCRQKLAVLRSLGVRQVFGWCSG